MKDSKITVTLLLLAALLITLLSCCSWIYPVQPVDDANWYMSIGKSMFSGKLLYTELHDQKGPLLFFIHEWAAALSPRSFLGIYLLEILCCFGFLQLSYRTMRLYAEHGISLACCCVVGVVTYASDFMWYGDTVEELSLPILLYVLYKTLRYARLGELPDVGEAVLIGTGLAAVFWMKFTVLALCLGALAALTFLSWKRRQMLLLLQVLTWVIAGACVVTALVLLYFVLHDNEADLYHSYFYFNLFNYTEAGKADASAGWWPAKLAGWALITGAAWLPSRLTRDERLTVALCLASALLPFVFFKVYLYYFLTVYTFAPLLICPVSLIRSRAVLSVAGLAASSFSIATNFNLMTLLTGNFPQAILSLASRVNADPDMEKQVLTVKSYDTGIYTLTDCLPPVKYFSTPNAYVPELVREQTAFLESARAKYLVRKDNGFSGYYPDFHPDLTRHYELVQEASDVFRPEFLLHPAEFLWTLGYMNGLVERFHTPEKRRVTYQLYRRKPAVAFVSDAQRMQGEWQMNTDGHRTYRLDFSRHGLVKYREYAEGKLSEDKIYSYVCRDGLLLLCSIYTGEAIETVCIADLSPSTLTLRGWPLHGNCRFQRSNRQTTH